ncbi:MAG: glycosyltransferase family 4 protein [Sedimentisphaeraceae bacterium JB056]
MQKLLYIDTPFFEGFGGDKNRSRFLYESLKEKYEVDVLLITDRPSQYAGYRTIKPSPAVFHKPQSVYNFSKESIDNFERTLLTGKYDVVFIRFCSPAALADVASYILPEAKIVVDVDMLLSRISALSWQMNRTIKNRFYFLENIRLRFFERRFFRNNYLFLFSNPIERDMVARNVYCGGASLEIIPNIMQDADPQVDTQEKYLLFYGALSSAANKDAYRYLAHEIYHHIEPELKKNNIRLRIVGKNMDSEYQQLKDQHNMEMVDLVGQVDDINAEIKGSEFVFLPLRVASGTRTRILEAAAVGRAVVTTTIGAEGLDFSPEEIAIADSPITLAGKVESLLEDRKSLEEMAACFKQKSEALYSAKVVAEDLIERIGEYMPRRKNVAIVTNRFYPEVGGAETNIYFQARRLSKDCNVTVFCPKRIDAPWSEQLDGFNLRRLKDFFNLGGKYPNIKTKTFTPSIFFKILFGKFDVVMCFPALSYNNMLAFFACKLSKTPIILCCFDWLDYSDIMLKEGRIDPTMIERHSPKTYQEFFLRRFDYIFAISNKEIAFFKKYNQNVGYSPVPILLDEYQVEVDNPRAKYSVSDDEFVFLSLGRVSKIKGQDIAAEAFVRAAEKMPDSKLVFVGRCDYDPDIHSHIKKIAEEKGLTDRVIFTGMVEREEVLGWLRNSDIHVIPVRFMNSGAVVVESWISHTPVLQSDVVDPNLVKDGQTGYLFRSESVDHLAEKMVTAYENRSNLKEMGFAGEELVKQKYTYEYLINLYLETFNKVKKK